MPSKQVQDTSLLWFCIVPFVITCVCDYWLLHKDSHLTVGLRISLDENWQMNAQTLSHERLHLDTYCHEGRVVSLLFIFSKWTEKPGGLQSTGLQKSWTWLSNRAYFKMQPEVMWLFCQWRALCWLILNARPGTLNVLGLVSWVHPGTLLVLCTRLAATL